MIVLAWPLGVVSPSQVDTTVLGLDAKRAAELPYIASMGIYVISKDAMIRMLAEDFPEANDFGSEVIPGACDKGAKVRGRTRLAAGTGCNCSFLLTFHTAE